MDYERPHKHAKPLVRGPDSFIQRGQKKVAIAPAVEEDDSHTLYWWIFIIGLAMLAFGVWNWFLKTPNTLEGWSSFAVPAMTMLGGLFVLSSMYYLIKAAARYI